MKERHDLNANLRRTWYLKYEGWAYEQEVRTTVQPLDPNQRDGDHYFAEFSHSMTPVEVLMGARCTVEDRRRLSYSVNRYKPALPIVQMEMAHDAFEMVRGVSTAASGP